MKPSPLQLAIVYVAAILQMLVVFHVPLHIPDIAADCMQVVALVGWIVFFVIHRQRKRAGIVGPSAAAPARPSKALTWLIVTIFVVVSLSGVFWLPYTGTNLTRPQLIVVSIVSCIFSLGIFLIARRRMRPKV